MHRLSNITRYTVVFSVSASIALLTTASLTTTSASASPSQFNGDTTGIAYSPDGNGIWSVNNLGFLTTYGDATNFGSLPGQDLIAPIEGVASSRDFNGYYMFSSSGDVFPFGNAPFYGSVVGMHINAPVVSMAITTDGKGYWLLGADGGIFAFGDARNTGVVLVHKNQPPAVGIALDGAVSNGYDVVYKTGFLLNDEGRHGSAGMFAYKMDSPVVGIVASDASSGMGYYLVGSDGGVFAIHAPFFGSLVNHPHVGNIVGIAASPLGNSYTLVNSHGELYILGKVPMDLSKP